MSSKVALYVDCENVSNVKLAKSWIDFANSQGNLIIQNAYTRQWGQSLADGTFLEKLGFYLVNAIFRVKNSVDCKCMFDCMDALQGKSSPDIFILVTGDGDYTHLLEILKGHQKKTIIFARRGSDSTRLRKAAHEFHFVDELLIKSTLNPAA